MADLVAARNIFYFFSRPPFQQEMFSFNFSVSGMLSDLHLGRNSFVFLYLRQSDLQEFSSLNFYVRKNKKKKNSLRNGGRIAFGRHKHSRRKILETSLPKTLKSKEFPDEIEAAFFLNRKR